MQPTVFYDAGCNLCNGAVTFLRRRDRAGRFRFVPLDSGGARLLLSQPRQATTGEEAGCETAADALPGETFLLLEDGRLYDRSTAALRTLRRLGGLWHLVYPLILIPRPLRDAVYTFIARRRRRWFGSTNDRCPP